MVDLPAPFGPISPTISPASTAKLTSLTATRPPKRLVTPSTSSSRVPAEGSARRVSGAAPASDASSIRHPRVPAPPPAHDVAREPGTREVQQADEEQREHHRLDLRGARRKQRQHVLERVLQQQDDSSAGDGTGELAEAARHRHQQVFDARAHVERRRADEAVLVRVEPAGEAGEQRGDDEERQAHAHRVGADAREQRRAAAQAPHRPARTRVEQVAGEEQRRADEHPDQVVRRARVGERPGAEAERRHVGDAAVTPERFEVAEHDRDREPPGDRRKRQVVAAEAQRDHADDERRQPGEDEREEQPEPRRRAVRGGEPGGRVGADADERGLAERGRAADAGEEDEAERDERGDADVVQERDREAPRNERRERERGEHGREQQAPRAGAHVSISSWGSSPCGSANERSSSTGIRSEKTIASFSAPLQNDAKLSTRPTASAPIAVPG